MENILGAQSKCAQSITLDTPPSPLSSATTLTSTTYSTSATSVKHWSSDRVSTLAAPQWQISCSSFYHNTQLIYLGVTQDYNNVTCEAGELKRDTGGSDLAN